MPRSKKSRSSSSSSKHKSPSPFSSTAARRIDDKEEDEEETVLKKEEGYEVSRSKKSRRGNGTPQVHGWGDKIPPHLLAQMKQAQPTFVGTLDIDGLDSSRDLWIIDCPKNVDLGSLLEAQKIKLDGTPTVLSSTSIVKVGERAEEINNEQCYESITRLLTTDPSQGGQHEGIMLLGPNGHSQFTIASTPLAGYISITQNVQETEEPVPIKKSKKKKRHKLPRGIKIRHPQYGVLDPSQSFNKVTKTSRKRKKNKSRVHTYY